MLFVLMSWDTSKKLEHESAVHGRLLYQACSSSRRSHGSSPCYKTMAQQYGDKGTDGIRAMAVTAVQGIRPVREKEGIASGLHDWHETRDKDVGMPGSSVKIV